MKQAPFILYFHGFLSSPASFKVKLWRSELAKIGLEDRLITPELPALPHDALAVIEAEIAKLSGQDFVLAGSSLGGFYAHILAEKYQKAALLLNPAIFPERYADHFRGRHQTFHSQQWVEIPQNIDQIFQSLAPTSQNPALYQIILAKQDEVLNADFAADYFQNSPQIVLEQGDHALSNFAELLPDVMRWYQAKFIPC